MPIYQYKCSEGHTKEVYVHSYKDKGCATVLCDTCSNSMEDVIVGTQSLLYFEEGRPRVIENLFDKPVVVRSHAEHKALMKKAGVEQVGSRRGTRGAWI